MASDINIRIGASITDLQKKLRKAEYSLKRSGNKMKSLGSDLMMGLSAPIGLFGVAAIKAAGDFEASMNGMKAVTAGGIDMFDELEATAKRLGATTQFSATEAAAGMEMLGRNGLTAQQILDGAAEASLTLAAATGTDLGNAANIATDAMAQFNLEANQLGTTADIITGATVNSKFGIDDFMNAMAQAGGVAGAVGVSFDDFATTVSAISPSFNSGADAGTSLKTMLTRLVPESKNAADMMRQLGIITADGSNQFFDAEGNMKSMSEVAGILQTAFAGLSEEQRIQASKTLFGTDAMRAGLKLAETGSTTYDNLKESIMGVAAADVAETRMEGFNGAILRLKSSFEAMQLAIADSGIQEFATMLIESLTGIILRISEMNPQILQSATLILGLAAAIGPLIYAFGYLKTLKAGIIGQIGEMLDAYKKYINKGLNAVLFAENRAIIVQRMRTQVLKVYEGALKVSTAVLSLFKIETYKSIAATVRDTAVKVSNKVATTALNAVTIVSVGLIQGLIAAETAYVAIKNVLTGKVKLFTAAQAALNVVLMANPIGLVIALIALLVVAFVSAYQNIEGFRNFIDRAMAFIKEKVMVAVEKIKNFFLNLPAYLNAAAAAMAQFVQNVANAFKRLVLRTKKFMKRFAKALTIDKDKRAELEKEIQKIAADEKLLEDNAKSVADVFNERLKEGIENGEQLDPKKIKEGIGETLDKAMDMLGLNQPTVSFGGGGDAAKAAEDEAKALREKNDELDKSAKLIDNSKTKQIEYNNNVEKATMLNEGMSRSLAGLRESQQQVDDYHESRTFKVMQRLNEIGLNGAAWIDRTKDAMIELGEQIKGVMEGAIQDLAVNIGEGIGAMAAGVSSAKDLGKVLLGQLAGVLEQLGKLAIQAGITMLGIQKMFEAGLAGGPAMAALAIGAGIALVALSKFAQSKIESMGSGGGEVNGGNGIPALANGGIVSAPTLSLIGEAGPEAVIPLSKMNSMFGGGGDSLKVDFPMDKMVIALDRQRRRNSRV